MSTALLTATPTQMLLQCMADEGLRYGREDSFKLSRGQLLAGRLMLGVQARQTSAAQVLRIAHRLGMPDSCDAALLQHLPHANVILFGAEQGPQETVYKLYLEFWDRVRDQVRRSGSKAPLLLDLGFKWRAAASGGASPGARVARYVCHPLLSTGECVGRMTALYGPARETSAHGLAVELVAHCAATKPHASFVYMEAEEDSGPRLSFDINLYKAELRMRDLSDWLARVGAHYAIDAQTLRPFVERIGPRMLGHLSGGVDRHGEDFLTVYYEIDPL